MSAYKTDETTMPPITEKLALGAARETPQSERPVGSESTVFLVVTSSHQSNNQTPVLQTPSPNYLSRDLLDDGCEYH